MLSLLIVNYHNKVSPKTFGSYTSAVQLAGPYFGSHLDTEWYVT